MCSLFLADSFGELISLLSKPNVIFWVAVAVMAVVPTALALSFTNRTRQAELETIRDLAAQGYTADEIERLVRRKSEDA